MNFLFIHVDLGGTTRRVGTLYAHAARGRKSASFRYAESWLDAPDRFALEPALAVTPARITHPTSCSARLRTQPPIVGVGPCFADAKSSRPNVNNEPLAPSEGSTSSWV